jgi:peroxidase
MQTKGPHWDVPTGRRDGRRSVKEDALKNLPPPFFDASRNLNQFFIPKGLDAKDQVVLLGILLFFFRSKSQRIIR